jgi:hypothetical protein
MDFCGFQPGNPALFFGKSDARFSASEVSLPETFWYCLWSNDWDTIVPICTMRLSWFPVVIMMVVASLCVPVLAANPPANAAPPLLPETFGGWQMQGSPRTSTYPAAADAANSAVLKEYRFTDSAFAVYTRDDGRTLKIHAARFADASGAFGAYTFYLRPDMRKEDYGDQGASVGDRGIFYKGHILIDAQFSQETAMSGAELRELAAALPRPGGNAGNLPSFIQFLPRNGYVANTQKYVMGEIALNALAAPVSADLVDFGASSEVTLAHYSTTSGEAILTLISYPTPQLAGGHRLKINASHQLPEVQSGDSAIVCANGFCDKRTGPIVAIVTGGVSDSDAKSLLGMVNYEASVTWNTPSEQGQVRDLYKLILNIVVLCGILAGLAIVAGVAFGGIRVLVKKMYPDRVFDRPEQMEFISLRLTETVVKGASQNGPDRASGNP